MLKDDTMTITDWPKAERPREKLLSQGAKSLSDAELLALFLRTGTRGKTAVDLGRELLCQFGGLRELLETDTRALANIAGMGPARATQLTAILELGQRYLDASLRRDTALTDPTLAGNYIKARLRGYSHEVFACLFLDNRHRVLAFEEMFRGTIDGAAVYPREVVKRSLQHNAAAVILAHNHPSGVAEPSQADRHITEQLVKALGVMDIRVLDHLVIGDTDWVSLAARGWV
jgi:DNA repair protein RadC